MADRTALALVLAAALAAGCARPHAPRAAPVVRATPTVDGAARARDGWSPPADWRSRSTVAFERLLDEQLPAGTVHPPSGEALQSLARALDAGPAEATRAALLLARTGDPAAQRALLGRLERRVAGPGRADDAGDCTAAAALARGPLGAEAAARLAALATGPDPHPDLEVRTECAIAALARGRDEVVPWLLAVLRIDTAEAARRGERVTDSATTAWARGRAAEALCARAGVPHAPWSDAPLAERERRALELERLLAAD